MKRSTNDYFWARCEKKENGCWVWVGATLPDGYGILSFKGKSHRAHRLSYSLAVWEIPVGVSVCHKCDNPACINPDHLFLGTQADNVHDCVRKGRRASKKGTNNGRSKLSEKDVKRIRKIFAEGKKNKTEISKLFGVSDTLIGLIVRRKSWPHVV